jgi:hypothetical protein
MDAGIRPVGPAEPRLWTVRFLTGATVLLAAGLVAAVAARRSESRASPRAELAAATASFTAPARSGARPSPAAVPEVPDELASPPDVTVEVETRLERSGRAPLHQRKSVLRTSDRVLVSPGPAGPDWLFVRNPKDRRRLSATMIDHRERLLVSYDESELRAGGLGRGWADIASLGVEPEALARLQRTGRSRTVDGLRFDERRPRQQIDGPIRELWWSSEAGLPLRVAFDDRTARTENVVREIRRGADAALLRDPRQRYPGYTSIDVADYREGHHDERPASPDR